MRNPLKMKLSARGQLKQNENAMNYWADSFGKPRVDYGVSEKRTQRKSVDGVRGVNGGLLESAVQAQIIEYLRIHPRVKWFARINSGSATGESGAFVRFYRLYLRGMKERATGITDIIGQTDNGCFFVIECKREGVFKATDEQNDFMDCVVGAKGVAQSLGDAMTVIEQAIAWNKSQV